MFKFSQLKLLRQWFRDKAEGCRSLRWWLKSATCWLTMIIPLYLMINLRQMEKHRHRWWILWISWQQTLTFVVVHLVLVSINHVHLQEVEESTGDQEPFMEGKTLDVTRVQCEGVGRWGDGAQTDQLTHHVPHSNSCTDTENTLTENQIWPRLTFLIYTSYCFDSFLAFCCLLICVLNHFIAS